MQGAERNERAVFSERVAIARHSFSRFHMRSTTSRFTSIPSGQCMGASLRRVGMAGLEPSSHTAVRTA